MTKLLATLSVILLLFIPAKLSSLPLPKPTLATAFESKIRKAWQDYKNKDKASFAAIFSDDFTCIKEGAGSLGDKKSEVDSMDQFDLKEYTLSDFTVKQLAPTTAVVTYVADYAGNAAGTVIHQKSAWGEVWTKYGSAWKLRYLQETKLN